MIISHGRRYIFVHIPKTGGTALSLALEARAMKDDILVGDTDKANRRRKRQQSLKTSGRLHKHARLLDIYGAVSQDDIDKYYITTLVRNPWDRLVSYYHWLQGQTWDHKAVELARRVSFEEFLNVPFIQSSLRRGSYASYVTDQTGAVRCSHFIRLEFLTQDLVPFEAHLGFDLSGYSVENASDRKKDFRSYYSSTSVDIVANICADDIKRFGYGFE